MANNAEMVAEGRTLIQELHDKHDASRRKDDEAAERHYQRGDNARGKKYADRADAHEAKQDALCAFLAHHDAQAKALEEANRSLDLAGMEIETMQSNLCHQCARDTENAVAEMHEALAKEQPTHRPETNAHE